MHDTLSDIFSLIRLTSCVYFQRDFFDPWAMRIEGTGFAQFHVVTRGVCVVEVGGWHHDCSVGDVLVFPHGDAHTLADQPGREAVPGAQVMAAFASDEPYFSHGNTCTRLICGHYEFRRDITHPVIADLPGFIHIRSLDMQGESPILSTLPMLMNEISRAGAGSRAVVERYAEIMLIQVLRIHAAKNGNHRGLIATFNDERLFRAVARIHQDFGSAIVLEDLAREAALSRSAFAQRFRDVSGMAPTEYLTKWRMLNACDLLQSPDLSIARVSNMVGYESDISFSRAFKREFGVTPSQYRRQP